MGPLPHVKRVSANFPTKLPNAFPTFHVIGLSGGYGVCVFGLHYVCRSRRRRHRLECYNLDMCWGDKLKGLGKKS